MRQTLLFGILRWFRWAVPFVFNLWPYFRVFILTSTFWIVGRGLHSFSFPLDLSCFVGHMPQFHSWMCAEGAQVDACKSLMLGVPVLAVATFLVAQNGPETRAIVRAAARRAMSVNPAKAWAAVARVATDAAVFPATLAESLGKALVPGGWIHVAVSVATSELAAYPAALAAGVSAAARRFAAQATALDAKVGSIRLLVSARPVIACRLT